MNIRKYSDTNIIPSFCCIMQLVVGGSPLVPPFQ